MPRQSRLQRDVHAELTALLSPGGPLAAPPDAVRDHLTPTLILDVAAEYRAGTPGGSVDGHAVVITAGPPGAGKSTALSAIDDTGYRRIDPDDIKDLILRRLEAEGLTHDRHRHTLKDGQPVTLGELAGWVHQASTDASDIARGHSLAIGENFIMEGTLGWEDLPAVYQAELADHDYEHLAVVDVEVPLETAIQQAAERWWTGRASPGGIGGRFIPDAVIEGFYPESDSISICATRARALYEAAQDLFLPTDLRTLSRGLTGTYRSAFITPNHVRAWDVPDIPAATFGAPCVRCGRPLTNPQAIQRGLGDDCARH